MEKFKNAPDVKLKYSARDNIMYMLRGFWELDKKSMLLSLLQFFPRILLPLFTLLLSRLFIDCIINNMGAEELIKATLIFIIFFGIMKVINHYLQITADFLGIHRRHKYDVMRYDKLMTIRYDVFESVEGKKLLEGSRQFTHSESSGARALWGDVRILIFDIIGVTAYSAIISYVSPALVVLILVLTAVSFVLCQLENKDIIAKDKAREPVDLKSRYILRTLREEGVGKDLRLFGMGYWFRDKRRETMSEFIEIDKYFGKRRAVYGVLSSVLVAIRDITAYGVFINRVVKGTLNPADFVFYIGLVTGFSNWTLNIKEKIICIDFHVRECDKYRQFMDLPDTEYSDDCGNYANALPARIEFRNVSFVYPNTEKEVLKNVSFTAEPGEKLALVGVNGAGKTTCMKLLCGLYLPTKGEILINGKPTSDYKSGELVSMFSALFQEYVVLPVSVAQNVSMLPLKETDNERVRNCLEQAGLLEKCEENPDGINSLLDKTLSENAVDFSGGERQRLLLARALYKNSPYIILDEPTAALDPLAEHEMYLKYNEMTRGRTSFYISHRLASTRFCDKILLLEDGVIKEHGSHEELMNMGGSYSEMYEIQSRYYREKEEL